MLHPIKDGHNSKLAGLFTISIPITFVLSLSTSLLLSNFIPEDLKLATSFMVIYSFSSILIEILSARLRASGEFLNIVASETLLKNGLIFIGLILLYNTSNVLVSSIFFIYLLPNILLTLYFTFLCIRNGLLKKGIFVSSYLVKSLKEDIFPLSGHNIFQMTTNRSYYLILNFFLMYELAAIFRLSMSFSQIVTYVSVTLALYFSPKLAKELAEEERKTTEKKIIKVNILSFVTSMILALCTLLILTIFAFRNPFTIDLFAIINILIYVYIPIIMGNLFALNGTSLLMMGKSLQVMKVNMLNTLLNFLIGPFLISNLESFGLIVIISMNYLTTNLLFNYLLKKENINLYNFNGVSLKNH